jgi:hypothetical protein
MPVRAGRDFRDSSPSGLHGGLIVMFSDSTVYPARIPRIREGDRHDVTVAFREINNLSAKTVVS